jgi:hypothetical protein
MRFKCLFQVMAVVGADDPEPDPVNSERCVGE